MFVIGEEEYDDVVVGFTVDTEVWLVVDGLPLLP